MAFHPPANFTSLDHGNLQSEAPAVTFAFPILATVAVTLRLYSHWMTRTFGYDDWFICIAAVIVVMSYVGYHVYDIPFAQVDFQLTAKFIYAAEMIYVPILGLIKISIAIFLFRISGQKKMVKRAILSLVIFNVAAVMVNLFFVLFQCLPIAAIWNREAYPNAKCLNFNTVTTTFASINVVTDAMALILPTWIMYDLKIGRRQKVMLIGILSFGLVTVVSGLVRAVLLAQFAAHPPKDFTHSILFCISSIEVGLAFVAAGRFGRTAGKSTRPVYKLSESRTWKGTQTMTRVDTNGDDHSRILKNVTMNDKTNIMMTRETEVKWQDNPNGRVQISTESLV
ncbi:hypothetical protein V8E51_018644 [Hyaloscypha variabilis]